MKTALVLVLCILFNLTAAASNYIDKGKVKYHSGIILVKFKSASLPGDNVTSLSKATSTMFADFSVTSMRKALAIKNEDKTGLKNLFELKYSAPMDPEYVASRLCGQPEIEWAEPYYIYETAHIPNDTYYNSFQQSLSVVQAEQAWDITKGSSDVIIAIVDTGVDWDHPDLADNIWINEAEANGTQGIDDDNNGYVDDIRGWDFGGLTGTPDNDPVEDSDDHGTHVAGIAGAVTNNGIGVASIGYNCMIMAVKTSEDDIRDNGNALIAFGYDGILYAVDNGAKVINCSWGSYSYSKTLEEIIEYAAMNGAIVVGSAGNENNRDAIYPGNYKDALSVGYTDDSDVKNFASNYGEEVDIYAPGTSIYNTWQNDTYASLSGSSMAAPLVSGIAALVFTQFPNFTPHQVAQQIRVNADNIDALNPTYQYLMGSGRVNAYKALTNTDSKAVRITNINFVEEGDGDGVFESGETVSVELDFVNYLSPLSNLSVRVFSDAGYITFQNPFVNMGAHDTLEVFDNSSNTFRFTISGSAPLNSEPAFRIEFTDGTYKDFQWIKGMIINPLYKTSSAGDLQVTFTSKGTIGFNDYPDNLQGDGFIFRQGPNILFEGGLMYGNSSGKIVSSVRSSNAEQQSDDFRNIQPYIVTSPGAVADEQGLSVFDDSFAGTKTYNIETELHTYAFAEDESNDFIILKYIFKNKGLNSYSNFFTGLYFDWDVDANNAATNITNYDFTDSFGYVYNDDLNAIATHAGMALLSTELDGYFGISNPGDSNFGLYDGYTDDEKWTSMTSGKSHVLQGPTDVSSVISSGPHTLDSGDTLIVDFALTAGESLEELRDAVKRSREKYLSLVKDVYDEYSGPLEYNLEQNYPNPFNPATTIVYSIAEQGNVSLEVFDMLGRSVGRLVNEFKPAGNYKVQFSAVNLSSGVYIYKLSVNSFVSINKMLLIK
ncbi:MAG: S8 family serine peptidase [Melioribacteraceae bacterium]|nr:S8 family serine peptidase [Melioribacteraceae bacterium]